MDKYKDKLVNKCSARGTPRDYKLDYQKHKEKKKQYQRDNFERIKEQDKERQKVYVLCEVCNKQVKHRNMARHIKGLRHLQKSIS